MSEKKLGGLFLFFFVAISIFLTLGKMGNEFNPFAFLGGDMAVYASIAAAQDDPGLFAHDPFLSNEKNINSYNMIFFPIIRELKTVFGSYGTACLFLLPFFILIHLIGYYVLGNSIFRNPWAGFYTSLIVSVPVSTYYDDWGIFLDALPRFLYQALLPFLLALSIVRGRNPNWWPVILSGLGILNYVHPVSTPVWIVAIMIGLWISADGADIWKKTRMMALAILILVIILSPFLANYFNSTVDGTSTSEDYDLVMSVLKDRFFMMRDAGLIDVLLNFLSSRMGLVFDLVWYLVLALAAGGIIYGAKWYESSGLFPSIRQITAWMIGILIAGAVIPAIEQAVFARLREIPPEFELLRTLRFMMPLILLSAMCFLWIVKDRYQNQLIMSHSASRISINIFFMILLIAWGGRGFALRIDFRAAVYQNIRCWGKAEIICPLSDKSPDLIGVLNVIRDETPIGSSIFSEGEILAIRYYAFRPLMYTYKDGAPLAYTDQQQLLNGSDQYITMTKLAKLRNMPDRRKKYMNYLVEFALTMEADYIVLDTPYDPGLYYPTILNFIYSNANYSLYEIIR